MFLTALEVSLYLYIVAVQLESLGGLGGWGASMALNAWQERISGQVEQNEVSELLDSGGGELSHSKRDWKQARRGL